MNLLFWGLTVSVIGKVMLASGVLIAHSELAHERRVDEEVIRSFRLERVLTYLGLFLIIGGYAMEIYFYGFTTNLLTCVGDGCAIEAAAILSQ